MKTKFNKDYYTDGIANGLSCYENYTWIPELTYPIDHAFFNFMICYSSGFLVVQNPLT